MSEFDININLLIDIISKKKSHLEQILNITLNQRELLGKEDSKNLFIEMNKEKQILIDDVLALDNVFQRKFDLISHNFNSKIVVNSYREKIALIQDYTKSVLRLDNEIRVQEEKNTKRMKEVKTDRVKTIEKIKEAKASNIINLYKSNGPTN